LIGEHTDYNGGLVLPAALEAATGVAIRFTNGTDVRGISREEGESEAALGDPPRSVWLDYVRGVARLLAEAGRIPQRGFQAGIAGDVPTGSGLSSSAALEVASALALAAAAGRPFEADEALEAARLCQRAESEFVGVPCGILDPFASLLARPGRAILLDCARMTWEGVALPAEVELLIVDTGVRRELREGGYAERRVECETALEGARTVLGRDLQSLSEIRTSEIGLLEPLPEAPLRRLRHVVTENDRVRAFVRSLRHGLLSEAGEVLYASHTSLRLDFEVTCPESDLLVEASRDLPGALGARMTGAGWGGCTLHLVRFGEAKEVREGLAGRFEERFGRRPRSWQTRPGPGARVLST
jgi:galactokinase